jgi:hypothetical protein
LNNDLREISTQIPDFVITTDWRGHIDLRGLKRTSFTLLIDESCCNLVPLIYIGRELEIRSIGNFIFIFRGERASLLGDQQLPKNNTFHLFSD